MSYSLSVVAYVGRRENTWIPKVLMLWLGEDVGGVLRDITF